MKKILKEYFWIKIVLKSHYLVQKTKQIQKLKLSISIIMQYTLNTIRVLLVLEKKTCFKSRYFSPVLTSQFQSFICCGAGKEAQIAKKSFQSPSCLRSTWLGHTKEMMDRVGVKHHNMRIYFFLCQNVNNAERRNFFFNF